MLRLNRERAIFASLLVGAAGLLLLGVYFFVSNEYVLAWLITALGFAAWGFAAKREEEQSIDLEK